jgi:hypothetical protein
MWCISPRNLRLVGIILGAQRPQNGRILNPRYGGTLDRVCKSAKTPQFANSEKTANYQITHFLNPSLYHIIKMQLIKDLKSI